MRAAVWVLGLSLMNVPSYALEGMWLPEQVPALADQLRAIGFEGNPSLFANLGSHPMAAVVSLGGCSASFVSPDGLVITNHHCVTGMLQYNSSPERNLLRDGFHAPDRAAELWTGPASRLWVTVSFREVTAEIVGDLPADLDDLQLQRTVEDRTKARVAMCERDGLRCRVASFFGGLRWFEIAQREIHDLRLVYVPAEGVGDFGGETDNFRWPRHTGDFAILRAYVAPNGSAAPFSKDNVPFRPEHWLRISPRGASPGEVVLVAGYPGNTDRYATLAEVRAEIERDIPRQIAVLERKIATLETLGRQDPELAIKSGASLNGLRNGLTYRRGMLEGLRDGNVLSRRETADAELRAWIEADPARRARYGEALPALDRLQAEIESTSSRDAVFKELFSSSAALRAASTAYRLSLERPKPDAERDPDYQEREWSRIRERSERAQRTLDPAIDRALLRDALLDAARLPAEQRIPQLDRVAGLRPGLPEDRAAAIIDGFLDRLYSRTRVFELEPRLALLERSSEQLANADDTMVRLAVDLSPFDLQLEERDDRRAGTRLRLVPRHLGAILERSGGLAYPDANSTLRVTFGVVEGSPGPDGVLFTPQTTLTGMVRKHTGEGEFRAPQAVLEAAERVRRGALTPYRDAALGDVPVNFLSSVDTTGGNSGSPTMNTRGELVGLLFDGIWESITADFVFDDATTRSIHVDSRYVLWNLAEVGRADALLRELGIVAPSDGQSAR